MDRLKNSTDMSLKDVVPTIYAFKMLKEHSHPFFMAEEFERFVRCTSE